MREFVHLHLHTEYSLLDGACRIQPLMEHLKKIGQKAVAITDHGVMYGAVDFYKAAKKAGIKPIIGCELYVAARTRFDRVYELDAAAYHLVLLCKNETGYKNLIKLCSAGFTEGFYIKPRIDFELLKQHSEGLVCLSACLAGEVQQFLLNDNYEGAKECALKYDALFGRGNYYLEIQDHGIEDQKKINVGLIKLSRETGIPLVATNDAHYIDRSDYQMHDVLLCIQTGKTLEDEDRMRFTGKEFYVKSGDEMEQLFPYAIEALENTVHIAEMCNMDFVFGHYHLPAFQLPEGETDAFSYLEKLCWQGFAQRYPQGSDAYRERLQYELGMIQRMGFVEYFLIVGDFISFARSRGIPVGPGRGSGAGSMAAYCMRITDVDPMRYSLFFERFINPERVSMPDFDIDFCPNRRQEVIEYVNHKYGEDHVAQIVTFGTMAARAVVRDVGRVMNMPYAEVDLIAKMIPQELKMTLDKALTASPDLKRYYDDDPRVKALIDMSRQIEGMPRNCSTHAAGVIIASAPVDEFVPLSKGDQGVVTQYVMTTLEELGLLKMDFLGLRNLTIIDDAVKMIHQAGKDLDWEHLDYDDQGVFEMLCKGHTAGVFQMESSGMTDVAVRMKPHSVEDLTAIVALFRPGPMQSIPTYIQRKHNPQEITYAHPLLKDILSVTYGCIVYQEQVMEIFRVLAGYSLGRADVVRRAMSKKKFDVLEGERANFVYGNQKENIPGCASNGVPADVANHIFDEMLDFANYAFNKAHAVCYAVLAYQTAYLKYHYPQEYMAALLTSVLGQTAKVSEYIAQCKDLGITVLPPDINESRADFTVAGENIRFGIGAVKNVGVGLIEHLVKEREQNGKFQSFEDFCQRMSAYDLNKRMLENLIKCGAFDSLGHHRSQLMAVYVGILDAASSDKKKNLEGQIDLFADFREEIPVRTTMPNIPEYPVRELLSMERETCGLYLSGHPMEDLAPLAQRAKATPIGKIHLGQEDGTSDVQDGDYVTIAGMVSAVKMKLTKKQTNMAYITIEDLSGSLEVMAFEKVLITGGSYFQVDQPVLVYGRVSAREDEAPKIICDMVAPLNEQWAANFHEKTGRGGYTTRKHQENFHFREQEQHPVLRRLCIKLTSRSLPETQQVARMIMEFPGKDKLYMRFEDTGEQILRDCAVSVNNELVDRLEKMLGRDRVVIQNLK